MDPVDTGRKLDVHETSRRLLNVLCTLIYVLCLRERTCAKEINNQREGEKEQLLKRTTVTGKI